VPAESGANGKKIKGLRLKSGACRVETTERPQGGGGTGSKKKGAGSSTILELVYQRRMGPILPSGENNTGPKLTHGAKKSI